MHWEEKFYLGLYWPLVFLPLPVVVLISYLVWKFTGNLMANDITHFCSMA